jgi:hypothetical protein
MIAGFATSFSRRATEGRPIEAAGRHTLFQRIAFAFAALCLALLLATPVSARTVTEAEKAALHSAIEALSAALRQGNYPLVIKLSMPPSLLQHFATRAETTPEAFQNIVIEQIKKSMAVVKIESFSLDFARARYGELRSGEPYVLIPTTTAMTAGDRHVTGKDHTLAFVEDGRWFLIRISDDQQIATIREAYPDYQDVDLPLGTMEFTDK